MALLITYIVLGIIFIVFFILGSYNVVAKWYLRYKIKDFKEKMCQYVEGPEGIALKLANKEFKFIYEIPEKKILFLFRTRDVLNDLRYDLTDTLRYCDIREFMMSKYHTYIYYEIKKIIK